MANYIVGFFTDKQMAQTAIDQLKSKGYGDQISLIAKNQYGEVESQSSHTVTDSETATGIGIGAFAGAIAGLIVAAIPGVPILIGGPLLLTWGVTGAALGALSGGLVAAFVDLGFDEEEAQTFESYIQKGDIMVTVSGEESQFDEIADVLQDSGAFELSQVIQKD